MESDSKKGFILPLALVLATAILGIATIGLKREVDTSHLHRQTALRERAEDLVKANVPALMRHLESLILAGPATTAMLPEGSFANAILPVVVSKDGRDWKPLYSESESNASLTTFFQSPVSESSLQAEFIPLNNDKSIPRFHLAWAAEDIALSEPLSSPPESWPLPQWNLSPLDEENLLQPALSELLEDIPPETVWIPAGQPVPFIPESSPALVPVILSLGLKFGIFASGSVGSREKIIRIRYYLEGTYYNPYNRDLRLHDGSGLRPAFSLVWRQLPEVRIRNLTRGNQTGWLRIDESVNSGTGARGIHGWIRTKGRLSPGEVVAFHEPDIKWQPEGLARTLHPGFQVGPGDHIQVEFKSSSEGILAACLNTEAGDPLALAEAGTGWFRMENFPVEWAAQDFHRADDLPRPFYLPDGSLSFRENNVHWQLVMTRSAYSLSGAVDPRRRVLNSNERFFDASGAPVIHAALAALEARDLLKESQASGELPDPGAIFSWPVSKPQSLLEVTDLPLWPEGFRIGSKGAVRVNQLLDNPENWPTRRSSLNRIAKTLANGERIAFTEFFPVNHLFSAGWYSQFMRSIMEEPASFARFPNVSSARPADFQALDPKQTANVSRRIAQSIKEQPSTSVSDFFNRGVLEQAFNPVLPISSLNKLMPLRGWLRQALPFHGHGSAWILHLAMKVEDDDHSFEVRARVWMQDLTKPAGQSQFEILRFEWVRDEGFSLSR